MIDNAHASGERPDRRRSNAEARRQEILEIATEVFLECGYEGGAMSEVARRLGGSKETLYRYFDSKRTLFAAVVQEAAALHGRRIFDGFKESADLDFDLYRLGCAFLALVTSGDHVALRRAVIAEAGRSDLGRLYFEQGWGSAWGIVAQRLACAMAQDQLRRADPWKAAMHFRGLCQSGLYDMRLEGVIEDLTLEEISRAAEDAVDIFLRAFGSRRSRDARAA